jgi:hypothetical protein
VIDAATSRPPPGAPQRVPYDLREEASDLLKLWFAERVDTAFFNQLAPGAQPPQGEPLACARPPRGEASSSESGRRNRGFA